MALPSRIAKQRPNHCAPQIYAASVDQSPVWPAEDCNVDHGGRFIIHDVLGHVRGVFFRTSRTLTCKPMLSALILACLQACFGVSDFSPWSGQKGEIIKTEKARAREEDRSEVPQPRTTKDTGPLSNDGNEVISKLRLAMYVKT